MNMRRTRAVALIFTLTAAVLLAGFCAKDAPPTDAAALCERYHTAVRHLPPVHRITMPPPEGCQP